jgi:hypothetical protein
VSDIDFQNGFICGMATRGLTKGIPEIRIVKAENGYGGELTTWVLVTLNVDLGAIVSAENTEAFRVVGYKDWELKIYKVYQVIRADTNVIAMQTDDFDEADMMLEIYYMKVNGTLRTVQGLRITDFAGQFAVEFTNEKIKVRDMYTEFGMSFSVGFESATIAETANIGLQTPTSISCSDTYSPAAFTWTPPMFEMESITESSVIILLE